MVGFERPTIIGSGAMEHKQDQTENLASPQTGAEIPNLFHSGFFRNKIRAFWILQTLGWLGYGLLRLFNGWLHDQSFEYWKPSAIAMITGFVITLIFRPILKSIRARSVPAVIFTVIIVSVFFALIFSAIETIGHVETYERGWNPTGFELFGNAMINIYVLISWATLYLIINYSLMIQKEREKALAATSMAHQAQLKMLRYQLNPHFLFNTLNAISSLVLTKRYEKANHMLEKLSAFLRYSLVNQPTQKTTFEQELHALKLYLEIERVRFQKRLKVDFIIKKEARLALMPSLLLQPLIENAIKYAIAPSEKGGNIKVSGHCEGDKLILKVTDNGPGMGHTPGQDESQSSGVGIANIKARLDQLYGDQQSFNLNNIKPHGLEATIIIPCEFET